VPQVVAFQVLHGGAASQPGYMDCEPEMLYGLPQVVAFQATMELMAEQFPGAFAGYTLEVVESHQRTKADTSGTARAVVASFQKMGLDFTEVQKLPLMLSCETGSKARPSPAAPRAPLLLAPSRSWTST